MIFEAKYSSFLKDKHVTKEFHAITACISTQVLVTNLASEQLPVITHPNPLGDTVNYVIKV